MKVTMLKAKLAALNMKARDVVAISVVWALSPSTQAQGFQQAATNLTTLFKAASIAIIAGGVVGGLGAIGWGLSQLIKKGGDRGDDITWMSIGYKVFGGALLMVLGWVGGTAVETLGGSRGAIGAGV